MARVGLVLDRERRLDDYRIQEAAYREGVETRVYLTESLVLPGSYEAARDIFRGVDVVVNRGQSGKTRAMLTEALEECGYRVLNPSSVQEYSRNKLLASLLASRNGIPTPLTCFPMYMRQLTEKGEEARRTVLADRLVEQVRGAIGDPPYVEKPVDGTHGRGVRYLTRGEESDSLMARSPFDPTILQPVYSSAWEIRAVTLRAPGGEPRTVAAIAKCASEPEQPIRNLAVSGVPVALPVHNVVERLEARLLRALTPSPGQFAFTGNDWTPRETTREESLRICSHAARLLPLFTGIRESRGRLQKAFARAFGRGEPSGAALANLSLEKDRHQRLVQKYIRSPDHEAAQSLILESLDRGCDLLLLDVNDNQDFPNVRDITRREVEKDYIELSLKVASMPPSPG